MKRTIKLNESELKRIISESVKRVLNEGDKYGGYLDEIAKSINYFHSDAMENLENLIKTFEELPEEYSAMKNSNISMIRETISTLKQVYSGKKWEEKVSLSTMARYPNIGRK